MNQMRQPFLWRLIKLNQFIFVIAHFQLVHSGELVQAVTAFHALNEVMVAFLGIYQIDGSLVNGQNVGRSENADIGDSWFCGT